MVSIVVPIFNAGKYLEECIKSLIEQTYQDIEIILVNDGSTDNSGTICQYYEKKDSRIKYIYQQNQGPSQARNVGLSNITGDLLLYMDADDWLEKDAIEVMVKCQLINNADLSVFGIRKVYSNEEKSVIPSDHTIDISIKEYIAGIVMDDEMYGGGFIFAKLWNVKSIRKNHEFIKFDTELKAYEDKLWLIKAVNNVERVTLYPTIVYNYRIGHNSLSNNSLFDKDKDCILAYEKISHVITDICSEQCIDYLKTQRYYLLLRYLRKRKLCCDKKYRQQIIEQKELITHNKTIKITTKVKVSIIAAMLVMLEGIGR